MRPIRNESNLGKIMRHFTLVMMCMAGLTACATLVTDDHQSIAVRSDPLGAICQVQQGGDLVATISQTPGTAFISKSRHDLAINCTLPGYYPGAAVLESSFQDMTYGNLIIGGLIGVLVDTSSGAIKQYPRSVIVLLDRKPAPGEAQDETDKLARVTELRRNALRSGRPY
jgi:hypothetical protein